MQNCDWNLITAIVSGIAAVIAIYAFFRSGIEKLILKQTDILHKDIVSIKDDIREMREDSKKTHEKIDKSNERIDRLYQMFVDLLSANSKPKTDP